MVIKHHEKDTSNKNSGGVLMAVAMVTGVLHGGGGLGGHND